MSEPPRFTVSEIRDYENDGPLESTDIFLEGQGFSLLVNVPVGSRATYAFLVDGQVTESGEIGETAG